MIDLRSDTLTRPDAGMLSVMLSAPLGDSGRTDEYGRGEDPTVNALEDRAAEITGKERAILLPTGTMGNHVALLTYCKPGERVLVDTRQHLYRTEKAAFSARFGQLEPLFYHLTEEGYPDVTEIENLLTREKPALLCIENTHNGAGGTYIPLEILQIISARAKRAGIPVHMDGARLFNAFTASGTEVKTICSHVDSVMFCISKGLGAPAGSLLCGSRQLIGEAVKTRKLLGGSMRQAGVLAAAGLYALENHIPDLSEDHRRARMALAILKHMKRIRVPDQIQSNIILMDISGTGLPVGIFIKRLKERGVWVSSSGGTLARIVLYKGIGDEEIVKAAEIILALEQELT